MIKTLITTGPIAGKAIEYKGTSVKSVVLALFDSPQTGTDLTLLEVVKYVGRLRDSLDNPNRAVIALQLQTGQGGYYQNSLDPAFAHIASNYPNIPIDILAFGNGATQFAALMETYANKLRSVTFYDSAPAPTNAGKTALAKMYSYISCMNGSNNTVLTATNNLVTFLANAFGNGQLQSDGTANKQLKCWQGYPGPLIDTFVPGNGLQGGSDAYLGWLDSIDLDPAHLLSAAPKKVKVNGAVVYDEAVSGTILNMIVG